MLAQMSELGVVVFTYSKLTFDPRYHVGRHVANLQVTNTYEGTNVC